MYSSVLEWCVFPVTIYPRTGTTAGGDAIYGDEQTANGYIAEVIEVITDKTGTEYVSNSRVYFPASVAISAKDKIQVHADEDKREIRLHRRYYDGNTQQASIQVVYL